VNSLPILPLAITMMAGPQIMSAILFLTTKRPVAVSLAFLGGVLTATVIGVAVCRGIMGLVGDSVSLGSGEEPSSVGTIIQIALVALLILAAIKNYVRRETVEPPKWVGTLAEADPAKALKVGLLVILAMPSDIIIMLTVAANLEQNQAAVADAVPFILLTALVAALPLLGFLLFHRRAVAAMPKLRDWMNANAGIVNVIVCVIFIVLILSG
jgi:hypothetical protein